MILKDHISNVILVTQCLKILFLVLGGVKRKSLYIKIIVHYIKIHATIALLITILTYNIVIVLINIKMLVLLFFVIYVTRTFVGLTIVFVLLDVLIVKDYFAAIALNFVINVKKYVVLEIHCIATLPRLF